MKADRWYPIGDLLDLAWIALDASVGNVGLVRMGRTLFDLSHKENLQRVASSARQVLHMFDDLYRHANRGERIGGWTVLKFEPGYAELENTTPHHCTMEQGILTAALAAVGCPSTVSQIAVHSHLGPRLLHLRGEARCSRTLAGTGAKQDAEKSTPAERYPELSVSSRTRANFVSA